MKLIKKLNAFLSNVKMWVYAASASCFAQQVLANDEKKEVTKGWEERTKAMSTAFKDNYGSDFLTAFKDYIGRGGTVILLAISAIGFAWVAYAALAKFNECRFNKAEWAELAVLLVIAAGLLVFITLLISQGQTIITESKTAG